ncbi:MAG: hypothetical protein ACK4SY_05110 [Pyrobaculum sp.]
MKVMVLAGSGKSTIMGYVRERLPDVKINFGDFMFVEISLALRVRRDGEK